MIKFEIPDNWNRKIQIDWNRNLSFKIVNFKQLIFNQSFINTKNIQLIDLNDFQIINFKFFILKFIFSLKKIDFILNIKLYRNLERNIIQRMKFLETCSIYIEGCFLEIIKSLFKLRETFYQLKNDYFPTFKPKYELKIIFWLIRIQFKNRANLIFRNI